MRNAWIVAIVLGLLGACQDGEQKQGSVEAQKAEAVKEREATAREVAAQDRAADQATTRGVGDQRELEQLDALMVEQQRLVDEATAAMEAAGSDAERETAKQRVEDLNRRLVLLREKQAQVKARMP